MKYILTLYNQSYEVDISGNEATLSQEGRQLASFTPVATKIPLLRYGKNFQAHLNHMPWEGIWEKEGMSTSQPQFDGTVLSPFAGKVTKVNFKEGDTIDADATLMVVEAMKMEYEVVIPQKGVVEKLMVSLGEQVTKEQVLGIIKIGN